MYTVEIKLDIMLATKSSSNQQFRIVVAILMMKLNDGTARWGHLGEHDYRMPTGGNFSKDGGDVILKDMNGNDFVRLTNFTDKFDANSAGAIKVYDPEKRQYPGMPIQWRGSGKWSFLHDRTPPSTSTWTHLRHNLSQIASATDWYISSCYGFTVSGGAGGWGAEYQHGNLEFTNESRPNDPPFKLTYNAFGGGRSSSGVGGTISPSAWTTLGTYVVRGTLPTYDPFHPRQLVGQCVIFDISVSGTVPIPVPKTSVKVPGGLGGAGTMFLFGTLPAVGSVLFTSYKAGAVALGGAVALSRKPGGSASAMLSLGYMSLG